MVKDTIIFSNIFSEVKIGPKFDYESLFYFYLSENLPLEQNIKKIN